jgi:hypothetical protein
VSEAIRRRIEGQMKQGDVASWIAAQLDGNVAEGGPREEPVLLSDQTEAAMFERRNGRISIKFADADQAALVEEEVLAALKKALEKLKKRPAASKKP